jgi:hypothetical protein
MAQAPVLQSVAPSKCFFLHLGLCEKTLFALDVSCGRQSSNLCIDDSRFRTYFAKKTQRAERLLRRKEFAVDLWQSFWQIMVSVGVFVVDLLRLGVHWWLVVAWIAWWLVGVNWKKLWPVLAGGAWVPLVLLMFLGALAWSRMAPSECNCFGFVTIPNFWWQLGSVGLLVSLTFFCGRLQGIFGWTPEEVNLDPPAPTAHGHAHH